MLARLTKNFLSSSARFKSYFSLEKLFEKKQESNADNDKIFTKNLSLLNPFFLTRVP